MQTENVTSHLQRGDEMNIYMKIKRIYSIFLVNIDRTPPKKETYICCICLAHQITTIHTSTFFLQFSLSIIYIYSYSNDHMSYSPAIIEEIGHTYTHTKATIITVR